MAFRLEPHAPGLAAKSVVDDLTLHLGIVVVAPLKKLFRTWERLLHLACQWSQVSHVLLLQALLATWRLKEKGGISAAHLLY